MYLKEFIHYIQSEKRYSDHTITSYKVDLNQFFNFLIEEYNIDHPQNVNFKIISCLLYTSDAADE